MSKRNNALRRAVEKGYRADRNGNVTSPDGRTLRLQTAPSGRKCFGVHYAKSTVMICVHRLVAYQKFGEKALQPGIETRHLDGDYLNNSESNIAIGTHAENTSDEPDDFRKRKLTSEDVGEIRKLKGKESFRETAKRFGITWEYVSQIQRGRKKIRGVDY